MANDPNEVRLDSLRQGDRFALVLSTGRRIVGTVRYIGPGGVAVEVRPENDYREAVVTDREGHKRAIRIRAPSRIEHWAASTPVIPEKGEG